MFTKFGHVMINQMLTSMALIRTDSSPLYQLKALMRGFHSVCSQMF